MAHEVSFLDLIQGEKQFQVPLYQRTYSWADKEIAALFELKADIRGKALWRMLYKTCARAEEILTLNIEDCPPGPSTRNGPREIADAVRERSPQIRSGVFQVT